MTSSAPRYHERVIEAIRTLDDERLPMAETCRRVTAAAERLGLPRPSYVHVRRLLHVERERRRELREIRDDLLEDIARHRVVDVAGLALRLRDVAAERRPGSGTIR